MAKKIVIVEDDNDIRDNYIDLFTRQGYEVTGYPDRAAAEQMLKKALPDLVILDIGLKGDMDGGFELCRLLRQESQTLPIIFLTARDSAIDEVLGLRLGADDYLTKDIGLHQLLARVSALLRRVEALKQRSDHEQILQTGDLYLNMDRLEGTWKERPLDLTVTETWILRALVQNPGHVKSRDQLMQAADTYVDTGTITSHIKRLRKKFLEVDDEFEAIESVYGAGYRWKS